MQKIEVWNTRYGKSTRVVARAKGRFISNKSHKQVAKVAARVAKENA